MIGLIGIGVGPGDPELLTIKACKALKRVDVLFTPTAKQCTDSLALTIAKPYLRPDLEIVERVFPMIADADVLKTAWDGVAAEIAEAVQMGKSVGFITLGDPMTYSTYSYLLSRLKGVIPIQTIPGITSYQSIAAAVDMPLMEGDVPLTVVPCTLPLETIKKIILSNDSVVLMKLSKRYKDIVEFIKQEGLEPYTRLVSHVTQEKQIIYTSLSDLPEEKMSYFSTIQINKRWNPS